MSAKSLAELLSAESDQVLARFVEEVRRNDLSPTGTSRTMLEDHIPEFLREIVTELTASVAPRMSQEALDTSATARMHGAQRSDLGYDIDGVIREYGILRHCIFDLAKAHEIAISIDEFEVISKCLNVGIAQAATAYAEHRDLELNQEKANLQFLAEAGQLLTSSLDYRSTLGRLTGLLVPRMADWCAIHLVDQSVQEMPIMHVDPSKIEMLRTIFEQAKPSPVSPYGFIRVMQTGESSVCLEAKSDLWQSITDDPAQLALFRALGTVGWITVPLHIQGEVFGAMTVAYTDSGRRYTESDLGLASELARRAAVAIDNARLFQLSQKERSRFEAATRAKDEFVAMVSHELRTPLNAILGWLRLMRTGGLSPEKRQHALEVIERNAEAQNRVVGDLLDISKIITGQIRISPAQVDLGNVIDMAVEGVRPAGDAKGIRLELDIDRSSTIMRGDGYRLQQVVWNLLANAVKFTRKQGVVRVRLQRIDSDLELTVEDDGEGIAPEFLPLIFESFRQYDGSASRAHGGLGLGLSIAKHIVELHGGTIGAESPGLGKGATFRVRLPISPLVSTTMGISRIQATEPRNTTIPPPAQAAPALVAGLRVLVVDDEPDARELVAFVLTEAGMEVQVAESVAAALSALERFAPHVILSDIGMPDEDGYSFIRRIRTLSDPTRKNIPAIALTAFARNEDRTRALVEGFNMHFGKPVEPTVLVNAVVQLAGSARG